MFTNVNPLGFFASLRAQNVDHVIGKTEELVSTLGPSQADLTSAQEALKAAKALYAVREYSQAVAQAKRAGALAVSLNERFTAYMAAWTAVQERMEDLRRLGLPTTNLEAALSAADLEVAHGVEEGGSVVPNYLGATSLLEKAMEEARQFVARTRETSREIFLATLAVEGLSEPQCTSTPSWLVMRLEQMVEQATQELALGNLPAARKLASEAKARADRARAASGCALERLGEAELVLVGLRAEGPAADGLLARIRSTREALARDFLDSTTGMAIARRLAREATSMADHYPRARQLLEHAERVYETLQAEGYFSYQVDAALHEARRALGAGDWAAVRSHVGRASELFVRRRHEREVLEKAIVEVQERAALLKKTDTPFIPDVQEILGRAKLEFLDGSYSGANEDLLLANVLMTQALRPGM